MKAGLLGFAATSGQEECVLNRKLVLATTLCLLSFVAVTNVAFAVPFFAETVKQAVFLSPLEEWMPTWHLEEYVSILEKAGYQVDVFLSENVSISFLKTGLAGYDIIILRTDSFTEEGMNYYCSGEPATFEARKEYAGEISAKEIQVGACVGFSAAFIQNNYSANSLRNGLVQVVDGYSADLSSAFLKAGAAAYMGYYDAGSLRFGRMDALSIKWLKFLAQGYTVNDATLQLYLYLNLGHGHSATWPAVFLYGDGDFKI